MTSVASRIGSGLFSPTDGSRTIVIHDSQPREEGYESDRDSADGRLVGSLRLRGGPRSRPAVSWNEDVVDNEGMGKKKSKICCIYHKPRRFDESSDEDDSSDSDSDNSGHDYSTHNHHNHHHHRHVQHTDNHNSNNLRTTGGESAMTDIIDDSEANTYERPIPNKHSKGKGKA